MLIRDDVAQQLRQEFAQLVHPVRLAVFSQALADPESEQVKRLMEELAGIEPRLTVESFNFVLDTARVEELRRGRRRILCTPPVASAPCGLRCVARSSSWAMRSSSSRG